MAKMEDFHELSTGNAEPSTEAPTKIHDRAWKRLFESVTGYGPENFQSFSNFTKWLHRPVDASCLAVFRISYGVAMLLDLAVERQTVTLQREEDPDICRQFPLTDFFTRPNTLVLACLYLLMFLGIVGVTLGYHFSLSCFMYIVPYWFLYLGDTTTWNNHSYLFGLTGTLFLFSQANNYWSLDSYRGATSDGTVPYWNYFLIKFQFFLLYMYAGLKKLNAEWLSGYAMNRLPEHWIFTPFCMVLTPDLVSMLIVHWFTAFFDFSIAFWMTYEKTRWFATPFMLSFHLMNSRLFPIGMFPYVCLAQVPMFFGFDWPKRIGFNKYGRLLSKIQLKKYFQKKREECIPTTNAESSLPAKSETFEDLKQPTASGVATQPTKSQRWHTIAILAYCALQLFLPYSHFVTKGFNGWTQGLYGYSWDMMVHNWQYGTTTMVLVDRNSNASTQYIQGALFGQSPRWSHNPYQIKQFARCAERKLIADYFDDPESSQLSSPNISIYLDSWMSLNERPMQRMIDPHVDILHAEWSPFKHTDWMLPLINDFVHMRPKFATIQEEVHAWNNNSDVLFISDFPGFVYRDFLQAHQINATLTVLDGNIRYKAGQDSEPIFLRTGQSSAMQSNSSIEVKTLGQKPSSFMMTRVDTAMPPEAEPHKVPSQINLRREFIAIVQIAYYFLENLTKCLAILIYDMPVKAFTYVFQRQLEELEMAKYELPATCPVAGL